MIRLIASILLGLLLIGLMGCIQRRETPPSPPESSHVERLAEWMTGSFSSQAQAAADSDYYDIRLLMIPVWTERSDGPWLYVEQAVADHRDKPYRQRVYHLRQDDDSTLRSTVYTMANPLRFVGRHPSELLGNLTPESLTVRDGCDIVLHPEGDSAFVGSTQGDSCQSTRAGAAYATAEVRITAEGMTSWDRGFDSTGTQVWGAEKGGYVFRRTDRPGL